MHLELTQLDRCVRVYFVPCSCAVNLCVLFVWHAWSELSTLDWSYKCLCSPSSVITYTLCNGSVYLHRKTKMGGRHFADFCHALFGCKLFAHIDTPRTLYGRCYRCLGSLVVIQQWVREEIMNNCFELVYICIDLLCRMRRNTWTDILVFIVATIH